MEILKNLRLELGVTQADVAKYLGITRQGYNYYETGKRQPDNETLVNLSEYFHVSTDVLLGNEKKAPSQNGESAQQLDDISFALSGEVHELTVGEKEDVLNFVKFVKAQRKFKEKREEGN